MYADRNARITFYKITRLHASGRISVTARVIRRVRYKLSARKRNIPQVRIIPDLSRLRETRRRCWTSASRVAVTREPRQRRFSPVTRIRSRSGTSLIRTFFFSFPLHADLGRRQGFARIRRLACLNEAVSPWSHQSPSMRGLAG